MAGADTDFKRNLLRGIFWDGEEATPALDLQAALKAACRARYADTSEGLALVGTSGNGASITFALPNSNYSQAVISSAVSQLYDLFDEATAELVADGTATPTDEQVLARMLVLLKPVRELYSDRSALCS